ncbi:MAG: hypothetical protein SVM80_00775 [Halobacteriota archaeon]|nr:hypothetical protein [Halobacteriota archaeon]
MANSSEDDGCLDLKSFLRSTDAVSPLIAMMLLIVIVTSTIAVIYAAGLPRIEEAREVANVGNIVNVFGVLQSDIKQVAQGPNTTGAGRMTKIIMSEGYLYVRPARVVNGTGYIEYNIGGSIVAYENGAVFLKYPYQEYSQVVEDPRMYIILDEEDVTHVHIHSIVLNGTNKSVGGSGLAQIAFRRGNVSFGPGDVFKGGLQMTNVSFTIESTFYRGWHDYFEEMLDGAGVTYTISGQDINPVSILIEGNNANPDAFDVVLYYKETEVIATV